MNYVLSLRIRYHALIRSYKKQDSVLAEAFGIHVHWGFWPEPDTAENSLESFLKAADKLSELHFDSYNQLHNLPTKD